MSLAYIGLGSNLDDPLQQIRSAVTAIASLPQSSIEQLSSVYQSTPVGPSDQPDFLNAALRLRTALDPFTLLDHLQQIEDHHGRERHQRWGPRTLDLDILLFDNTVISSPRLTVPHRELHNRDFVLHPLQEVLTENQLLPNQIDLATLLASCEDNDLLRTDYRLTD